MLRFSPALFSRLLRKSFVKKALVAFAALGVCAAVLMPLANASSAPYIVMRYYTYDTLVASTHAFQPYESVSVRLVVPSGVAPFQQLQVDATGHVYATFTLPANYAGLVQVRAISATQAAVASMTVTPTRITPSTTTVRPPTTTPTTPVTPGTYPWTIPGFPYPWNLPGVTVPPTTTPATVPPTTTPVTIPPVATTLPVQPTLVYLVPHQDDETASMGADISGSVAEGKNVYIVLVTDGGASIARTRICTNTGYCLTRAEFVAARNRELLAAARDLGVPSNHVLFENYADGTLTAAQADTVVEKYRTMFPGAWFKTMSWLDKHPDHYNLGYALQRSCLAGKILDCRWMQNPDYWQSRAEAPAPVVTPKFGFYNDPSRMVAAAKEYKVWDPAAGRYGIGFSSSPVLLDFAISNHTTKWHKDSTFFASDADRQAAATWISQNQQLR